MWHPPPWWICRPPSWNHNNFLSYFICICVLAVIISFVWFYIFFSKIILFQFMKMSPNHFTLTIITPFWARGLIIYTALQFKTSFHFCTRNQPIVKFIFETPNIYLQSCLSLCISEVRSVRRFQGIVYHKCESMKSPTSCFLSMYFNIWTYLQCIAYTVCKNNAVNVFLEMFIFWRISHTFLLFSQNYMHNYI